MTGPRGARLSAVLRWGLVDQVLSSLTNFVLILSVGRWLGPGQVGVVAIGFSAYLLTLVLQRSLVSEPLVVKAARLDDRAWRDLVASAAVTTGMAGLAGSALLGVAGLAVGGPVGRGLLLFSPWIVPALLQDFWRFILFREDRGGAAAANDAAWVAVSLAALPMALALRSSWGFVAAWGLGATGGALLGLWQVRIRPRRPADAWRWWRGSAWPLGAWLGLDRVIFALGTQGAILVLALVLTTTELGGLRAAQSIFAPVTLIGPAIGLPGLPALARALTEDLASARRIAMRLSLFASALAVGYMTLAGLLGGAALRWLFGPSFSPFSKLVIPLALDQTLLSAGMGAFLLLKAARRTREPVVSHTLGTVAALGFGCWFGALAGAVGASWGLAVGSLVATSAVLVVAARLSPAGIPGSPPRVEPARPPGVAAKARPRPAAPKVLFIMGWGRSGSTILDNMLGQLPGFFSVGELHQFWGRGLQERRRCGCGAALPDCPIWSGVLDALEAERPGVRQDHAAILRWKDDSLRIRSTWGLLRAGAKPSAGTELGSYVDLIERMLAAISTVTGARVIVDSSKRPPDAAVMLLQREATPYLVHVVRDPRAVAFSWQRRKLSGDTGDPRFEMDRHGASMSTLHWDLWNSAAEAVRRRVPADRSMLLRYEDLMVDPAGSLDRVLGMVGETADVSTVASDGLAHLATTHTVSGNPSRFLTGSVLLRADTEWMLGQRPVDRLVSTALALPMLGRYGYPIVARRRSVAASARTPSHV